MSEITPIREGIEPQAEPEQTAEPTHEHTWRATVSQMHTALMWCAKCGPAASVACTLAGNPDDLQWHTVRDVEA